MAEALSRLPLPAVRLQVNNRKLIEGFCLGLGIVDAGPVMRAIDRLDKLSPGDVAGLLAESGLSSAQADRCLALASVTGTDASFADDVTAIGVCHPLLDEGLEELVRAIEAAATANSETFSVVADLRIARGLDYYTGTVFEGRTAEHGSLSICAGGRYDSLASDGRTTYPGVGISLGVSRLLAPLISRGMLDTDRSVPSCVLVALPDDASAPRCRDVARRLRLRGIAAEVAPAAWKYGKQIRFAERRGIPYVWFPGEGGDEVRDIRSGAQQPGDPGTWSPPERDLRPQVVLGGQQP